MAIDHAFYLNLAIDEAWKYQLLTYPNPAVGALVLNKHGKIISIEVHKRAGDSHAEVLAITDAIIKLENDLLLKEIDSPLKRYKHIYQNYKNYFKEFTIYTTLEPCNHSGKTPACSLLLKELGFGKVVYGKRDVGDSSSGGAKLLRDVGVDVVEVSEGEIERRLDDLLKPFTLWQKDRFVFFKIAMSANGAYKNGIISSYHSRELVHKIRDKIDLLVIGGESVRVDRPTIDARYVEGKAPDVLILSKNDDFDRTIPLFSVPNRKVSVENSLERIQEYNFIMIEGGEKLFSSTKELVDWVMIFRAPNFKLENISWKSETSMKRLKLLSYNDDHIEWYQLDKE